MDDNTLQELKLKSFVKRKWILRAIIELREKSVKYQKRCLKSKDLDLITYVLPGRKRRAEDELDELNRKKARLFKPVDPAVDFGTFSDYPDEHNNLSPIKERRRIAPNFVRPLNPTRKRETNSRFLPINESPRDHNIETLQLSDKTNVVTPSNIPQTLQATDSIV